jgi:hypothetical protein
MGYCGIKHYGNLHCSHPQCIEARIQRLTYLLLRAKQESQVPNDKPSEAALRFTYCIKWESELAELHKKRANNAGKVRD